MHEGKLTAELSRPEATEEAIMFAATGQTTSRIQSKESKNNPKSSS